jgi:very-short-patch-repair endonuclease
LSHSSAANIHGLRVIESSVEISVPHGLRRPPTQFVRTHQSRRPLIPTFRSGLPCTPIARTVVDVACSMSARDDVRALVSDAVQRGLTTVPALLRETDRLPRSRPRWLRLALDEVAAGARSAGEAEFLRLVRLARLPMPELNARVRAGGRTYTVDALWADLRIVVEIDGAAHHAGIREWEADLRRQNALHAAGYIVLRFPVRRLHVDPAGVVDELRVVLLQRAS